jgi:thermitase
MRFCGHPFVSSAVVFLFVLLSLGENGHAQNMIGERRIRKGKWRNQQFEYVDRLIAVKIKAGVQTQDINAELRRRGASLVKDFDKLRWGLIELPEGRDIFAVLDSLRMNPLIERAEPEEVGHASLSPNDTYFQDGRQWALLNSGQNGGTPGADIHVTQAWDITRGSSSVTIGILDSGIPMNNGLLCHPDLRNANRIMVGPNYSGDAWASDSDASGHGTHVAGIAAAETGNATGIAGVAGGCKLLVVKVFDQFNHYSAAQLESGVVYAIDHGARVINVSGGSDSASAEVADAMAYADEHNVLVVAAAGNQGNSPLQYPAAYASTFANVMAVGATDGSDTRATYTNVGLQLCVMAPGGYGSYGSAEIYSTLPNYPSRLGNASGYGYMQGTSMAAPYVAGTAALMLSVNPNLTPAQIRTTIQLSADKVDGMGGQPFTKYYGYGRLNANAAVRTIFVPQVYPTVASALSAAVSGQTVVVAAGSYAIQSTLIVPSGVTVTINPGASLQFASGVSLLANGNLHATGATFTSTGRTAPGAWGSIQFCGVRASGSALIGCTIQYGTQIDVLNGANDVVIDNCSITNNSGHGIDVSASSSFTAWGNTIANGNTNDGIVVYGGSNNLCWGNTIFKFPGTPGYHSGAGILYISSSGAVTRNDIDHCNWGIGAIYGSSVNHSWSYGSDRNNRITNCLIGVWAYGSSQCDLGKFAGGSDDGNGNNSIYGNLLYNVEVGNDTNDPSRIYADDNWWGTDPPQTSAFAQRSCLSTLAYDHWWTEDHPWGGQPLPASSAERSIRDGRMWDSPAGGGRIDSLLPGDRITGENEKTVKSSESYIYNHPDDPAGYVVLYGIADRATTSEIVDLFESNRHQGPEILKLLLANLYQMVGKPDLAEQENNDIEGEASTSPLGLMAKMNNMRIELYTKGNVPEAGRILSQLEKRSGRIGPMELANAEQAFRSYVDPKTGQMPNADYQPPANADQPMLNGTLGDAGLMTNYPNPFNPTTMIPYRLSKGGYVTLEIFDIVGREVSTLVSETQEAGIHSALFDGARLASGVYFYRLTAPGVRQVKKMLLTK